MPIFTYTAIKDNKTTQGSAEAASQEALVEMLTHQGLKPLTIKEGAAKQGFLENLKPHKKVKTKDLVVFTRQLSTMISAGVPLSRALLTMQNQTENKYFKTIVGKITKDVESGQPLATSFGKFPHVFSDVYISMVAAGEAGGILDDILKRLAHQVEQDSSMRKKIKSAAMYPTVILIITVVAFFGIMLFVMPRLGKIVKDLGGPNAELPFYTQIMLNISGFMQNNALLLVGGGAVGIFLLRRYISTASGKYKFHSLLLKIPVLKTIVMKIAIARFARTFASLMSSGVGVLDALEVTGGAIGNKVIEKELKEAAKAVKNGKQLSEPLGASAHFPPIVAQMLAVGEETGQIDTILVKVADFYEEEVNTVIEGLSSLIEPLMIIVLGSMVGLIAASVMGPIANLSKTVGEGG